MENIDSQEFIRDLLGYKNDPGGLISHYWASRQKLGNEQKVLYLATMRIFEGIKFYLDNYEETISSGTGEPSSEEFKRIQSAVLAPFFHSLERLSDDKSISNSDIIPIFMNAIAKLEDEWNLFDRDNVECVLKSSAPKTASDKPSRGER